MPHYSNWLGLVAYLSFFLLPLPSGGFQSVEPASDVDVIRYHLSLELNLSNKGVWAPLNSMKGIATITFRNTSGRAITRVPFVLNRLLKLESASGANGQPLTFAQRLAALEGWENYQANTGEITLAKALPSGARDTVTLSYTGQLADYKASGMLYVQDALDPRFTIIRAESSAYPHLASANRASLRGFFSGGDGFEQILEITVPEGLHVASGHDLVEKRSVDSKTTFVYKSQTPVFQIILPIARYELLEVGPARIYFFPEDRDGAQRVGRGIQQAFELYTNWFGALRDGSSFALAEIPEFHGSQALRPTILQESTAFREAAGMPELYHEISHFWNVEDKDPHPARWNEGLATYLQEVVQEELGADPGRLSREMDRACSRLKKYFTDTPESRGVSLADAGKRGLTSQLSYTAGGVFFSLLDRKLGSPRLRELLKGFLQKHRDGASSIDFADYVKSHAPETRMIVDEWFTGGAYSQLLLDGLDFAALVNRYSLPTHRPGR